MTRLQISVRDCNMTAMWNRPNFRVAQIACFCIVLNIILKNSRTIRSRKCSHISAPLLFISNLVIVLPLHKKLGTSLFHQYHTQKNNTAKVKVRSGHIIIIYSYIWQFTYMKLRNYDDYVIGFILLIYITLYTMLCGVFMCVSGTVWRHMFRKDDSFPYGNCASYFNHSTRSRYSFLG